MKKLLIILPLMMLLLIPTLTITSFAATDSTTVTNVDNIRTSTNSGSFDDFVTKSREFSVPITITIFTIAGILLIVGFVVPPLRKFAGTMIAGVIIGFFLINYNDVIAGVLFACYDFFVNFLKS